MMAIRAKIADDSGAGRVFGLVAGKPGVGKTTQMTTFPKEEMLGISIEDGFLSIAGSGYHYVEVDSYQDILDILGGKGGYLKGKKYLYIDSLTEIYDILGHELKAKYTAAQNYAKNDEMKDKMLYLVRVARQLTDYHIFFTCHTKEEKNGMGLESELAFDGKRPNMVKKQFDLSILIDDVDFGVETGIQNCLVTSPAISKIAKARVSPWLDIELEDYEEANLFALTQKLLGETT